MVIVIRDYNIRTDNTIITNFYRLTTSYLDITTNMDMITDTDYSSGLRMKQAKAIHIITKNNAFLI